MNDGIIFTVGQAARELGWDYNRTIQAVYAGHLEAEMVNGRWKVSSTSVRLFMEQSGLRPRFPEDSRMLSEEHSDD